MNETAHVFGRLENLVGVACVPDPSAAPLPVAVLFLTPGMLHHTGPFGLHVEMARQLARRGIHSLRFCLSGIGESLAVGAAASSLERAADEVRQAMDRMQSEYGIRRFILFGLCSGADDGVKAALGDDRVVGLALMDGCGYPTVGFYLRRWLLRIPRRALRRKFWVARMRRIVQPGPSNASTLAAGNDIREFPGRTRAQHEFQELADRGVELYFLYTGGVPAYYNHAGQFRRMFPGLRHRDQIRVRYFPHLDHVVRLCEDRQLVIREFTAWMHLVATKQSPGDAERPNVSNAADPVHV